MLGPWQTGRRDGTKRRTCGSGRKGPGIGAATPPDVIVLDVRLPGMDGLTAMQHFRSLLGPVPIIVITAFGELTTAVSAVRNGAFDYLLKPFDLNVAERTIRRALRAQLNRPCPSLRHLIIATN